MTKVIPRWEWRTFSEDLHGFSEKCSDYEKIREITSNEIYILSEHSGNNVKIRNSTLEIKLPLRIDRKQNLEQWMVFIKSAFPISITDLAKFYLGVHIQLPYLRKNEFEQKELIDSIIAKTEGLRMVELKKHRRIYNVEGTTVEFTGLQIADTSLQTAAIEDTNPQRVIQVRKVFNMEGEENINYIKALKRLFNRC